MSTLAKHPRKAQAPVKRRIIAPILQTRVEPDTIAKRSCGTCRDRRILCDRAIPTCGQCSRSSKACKGYGLRLSWPGPNNKSRALVGSSTSKGRGNNRASTSRLVHTTSWDMEMHLYLTGASPTVPVLYIPIPFDPIKINHDEKELLKYFQDAASRSLTTFGSDPSELGNDLIRIAVAGDSPSAAAVFRALLALSSLHRYGLQTHAFEMKISAIQALAEASSSVETVTTREAIQHVAAGMLLCSFEIHQSSCTSCQWTWYIRGVKDIIRNAPRLSDESLLDAPTRALVGWVYYHDVLAHFTLAHWDGSTQRLSPSPPVAETSHYFPRQAHTMLEFLSEVLEAVSGRPPSSSSAEELANYRNYIEILDWKLRTVPLPSAAAGEQKRRDTRTMMELYQVALLVYLHRGTENVLDQEARLQGYVERGFEMFGRLDTCERQFPLFILGCEARTDGQRAVVLDLMARTERSVLSRSMNYVRILVQIIWTQDDLAEGGLNYRKKLNALISRCAIVPSLV